MKPRRGDVVEVEWADAQHINLGWVGVKEYLEAAGNPQAFTAGYLIGKTGDHLVLALSMHPASGQVLQGASIPMGMIRRTKVLGRGTKRVRKALRP